MTRRALDQDEVRELQDEAANRDSRSLSRGREREQG